MAGKVTIADIAEMAGVAKSTVSRYFNGGYVKEETREKIRKAAESQGYSPNTFARLKARESRMTTFTESRIWNRAKNFASTKPMSRPKAAPSTMDTGTPARAAGEKDPP